MGNGNLQLRITLEKYVVSFLRKMTKLKRQNWRGSWKNKSDKILSEVKQCVEVRTWEMDPSELGTGVREKQTTKLAPEPRECQMG